MKTKLPKYIRSVSGAKKLLKALHENSEGFHPEDSAHDIVGNLFTSDEADQLNALMQQIYALKEVPNEFDPCAYLIDHCLPKEQTGQYKSVYAHGEVYICAIHVKNVLQISTSTNIYSALEATPFLIQLVTMLKTKYKPLKYYEIKSIAINK